ncbi:hypothetical protein R6Q59_026178 [Mikania micrantha]
MAKDHSNKSFARSSYEKISKATFGFSRRSSSNPKPNIPNPSLPITKPPISQTQIPIEINPTPKPEPSAPPEAKPFKKFVRFSSSSITKSEEDGRKELIANKTFSEDKYNSYIDNTKMKMRAPSNVSIGRVVSRHESFNDMFSGYINRTKLRLRTTSSVDASK